MQHTYYYICLDHMRTIYMEFLRMSYARTANLLGAIALGLADNILDTAERHVAHGGCTPAALSVIGHEPGQSIDFLARVLAECHILGPVGSSTALRRTALSGEEAK